MKEAKSRPRLRTPTRRTRSQRTIQEDSDSETETEDPQEPVRSPVKRRRNVRQEKTKKVKKATSSDTKEFKASGNYKPGMQWNCNWSRDLKNEFTKTKKKWQRENGEAGHADRMKDTKATIERYDRKARE